jgi:hypothetical protein
LFATRCAYLGGLFDGKEIVKSEVKKRRALGGRKKKV